MFQPGIHPFSDTSTLTYSVFISCYRKWKQRPEFESTLNWLHTPEIWGEETLPPNFTFWKSCFLHVWIAPCRVHQKFSVCRYKENSLSKDKRQTSQGRSPVLRSHLKNPAVKLKLWRLNSIYFCPWLCQSAPLSECMDMSSCLLLSTKPSI